MKTIRQALIDEIHYPIPVGYVENRLFARGLDGESEISIEILQGPEFNGAAADCLWSLIQAPNISEADKSVTLPDRDTLLRLANYYYKLAGEPERTIGEPTVSFGW